MVDNSKNSLNKTEFNNTSELPPPAERRPLSRKRVLLSGLVTYFGGAHSFNCTIRDLSESGARIAFSSSQPIPLAVYLIDVRGRVAYEAAVVWNKGTQFGLKFLKTVPLSGLTDPKLTYLAKLWHARSAR